MTDSAKILNDLRDVFSILHDAGISAYKGDSAFLTLTVDCKYLAERIDKSYKCFYVTCEQIDKLELHPWMNAITLPQILLTDIKSIFAAELEILSADIKDGFVEISCNQHDTNFDYCGGTLLLNCQAIKINDQGNRELSIEELSNISKSYWDSFSKKVEQNINDSKQK